MNDFWKNKNVLVTAGPTKERLDPVRFISNESSGKMGYAIAEQLYELGANVTLISGPVKIESKLPKTSVILVETALEMFDKCSNLFESSDIAIFAAAVADYRPISMSNQKIKKNGEYLNITLQKNPDIAFEFGRVKKENQLSIGFALETENLLKNASEKLSKKKFDYIVMNSPINEGEGFGHDTNKISLLAKNNELTEFEFGLKTDLARIILQKVAQAQAIYF